MPFIYLFEESLTQACSFQAVSCPAVHMSGFVCVPAAAEISFVIHLAATITAKGGLLPPKLLVLLCKFCHPPTNLLSSSSFSLSLCRFDVLECSEMCTCTVKKYYMLSKLSHLILLSTLNSSENRCTLILLDASRIIHLPFKSIQRSPPGVFTPVDGAACNQYSLGPGHYQ